MNIVRIKIGMNSIARTISFLDSSFDLIQTFQKNAKTNPKKFPKVSRGYCVN